MHGTISLLTTVVIPQISPFQCARNYTQPQIEFFPPVQFSVAEMSHKGDEDSLADPYFKRKLLSGARSSPNAEIRWKRRELLKVNKLAVGFLCCSWVCGISLELKVHATTGKNPPGCKKMWYVFEVITAGPLQNKYRFSYTPYTYTASIKKFNNVKRPFSRYTKF